MSTAELTQEQLNVLPKIEKLLNLAAGAGTQAEVESATAKAQALLAQYNLDTAHLEDTASKQNAKREEAKVEGGLYSFQRDLWRAVAELNFCYYWSQRFWNKETKKMARRHALIGRVVNTRGTIAMATYLQNTIERLATQRIREEGWLLSSAWAWSYRKGMAAAVIEKLQDQRRVVLTEEAKKARAANKAGMTSAAGTALTIASHSRSEHEANIDFLMKEEGYSAKQAAHDAAMEAAYTAWAKENPDEAFTKFRYVDAEGEEHKYYAARSGGGRRSSGIDRDKTDWTAYKLGNSEGKKIGLDPQTSTPKDHKQITGSKDIYL